MIDARAMAEVYRFVRYGASRFGVMLEMVRQERQVTVRQLGIIAGVDTPTMSRVLHGKAIVDPDVLQRLLDWIGDQ